MTRQSENSWAKSLVKAFNTTAADVALLRLYSILARTRTRSHVLGFPPGCYILLRCVGSIGVTLTSRFDVFLVIWSTAAMDLAGLPHKRQFPLVVRKSCFS